MIMSTPPNWLRGSVIADQIYQKRGRTEKLCTARPPKRHERYFPTCLKTRFPLLLKSHQMVLPRKIMRVLSFTVSCYFFLETSYPIFWWAARESFFSSRVQANWHRPCLHNIVRVIHAHCPIIKPWVVRFMSILTSLVQRIKKKKTRTTRQEMNRAHCPRHSTLRVNLLCSPYCC